MVGVHGIECEQNAGMAYLREWLEYLKQSFVNIKRPPEFAGVFWGVQF